MKPVWLLVFGAGLVAACAPASPDAWEGRPVSVAEMKTCHSIASPLVMAIPAPSRGLAMDRLQHSEVLALSDAQAEKWIGTSVPPKAALASSLLDKAIASLESQRKSENVPQTEADDDALASLLSARRQSEQLKPFLVRAVMGFEGNGAFEAQDCGAVLDIQHESLGHSTPTPTRAPVIVFLSHAPKRVHADISVAE